MEFTPLILIHLFTAVGALVAGGIALGSRKGTPLHRLSGRIWVVLMLVTAAVSFGIQSRGHFSPIHVLSAITLVSVTASVFAAMHGRINAHRRGMRATYISLVVAGAFTLLPGRRLGDLLWSVI